METTAQPQSGDVRHVMSLFERYLSLWVFLCIIAGIALGRFFPVPVQFIGSPEIARVNLPVSLWAC